MTAPPLDGPHWRVWNVIARRYGERLGIFAARDMERDLKNEVLRAMFRRDQPAEGQPERELLSKEFWENWEIYDQFILAVGYRTVGVRARDPAIAERYRDGAFFLWDDPSLSKSDVDETEAQIDETTTPFGRPPEHPELEVLAVFYEVNKKALRSTDDAFKAMVGVYYKHIDKPPPSDSKIEKLLQRIRRRSK
jgi:hypothetical protein